VRFECKGNNVNIICIRKVQAGVILEIVLTTSSIFIARQQLQPFPGRLIEKHIEQK